MAGQIFIENGGKVMTHTFLLEIGLEDMPAHVILSAENQLVAGVESFLDDINLDFESITGFSTPRRFAVKVEGLLEKQADTETTVRGPAKRIAQDEDGNWTKAAIGFSKGQGGSVDDLIIKDENGEPYVYMEKFIAGKSAKELLGNLAPVIQSIEFPKNMKWGTTNFHYVRPIHWVVALLDEEVIPFEVFDVETGRVTEGHRFLGESIQLEHPDAYEIELSQQYVIADRQKRQSMIKEQIQALCVKKNWQVPTSDTGLLEEVTDLVEYPTAFYGEFDEGYLTVPDIVLETSMKDHQRYFPVRSNNEKNTLLPYFISVRNGNEEYIENVAKGNEKVLMARLADAKFFYEEDQKTSIDAFVEKLKFVNYHDQLGTIYEKQNRVAQMIPVIKEYVSLTSKELEHLNRITSIYKFDLMTQVVDEFPTLQGKIGEIYTMERQEAPEVSQAIGEQYLPLSLKSDLPKSRLGLLLALMDKMDTLIQFFSIDLIPTGSNDPYALRRQAIGVVRILMVLDTNRIALDQFIMDLVSGTSFHNEPKVAPNDTVHVLVKFIKDRLEQMMQSEHNISHDVRQATLESSHHNLNWILETASILEKEKTSGNFKEVVESITRVINMTDKQMDAGDVNTALFETDSEKELAEELTALKRAVHHSLNAEEFYKLLQNISPYITNFFENNMVMVDNEKVKDNRLSLLSELATTARQFADFSQIVL